MITSLTCLLFDITDLPAEHRTEEEEYRRGRDVNYISVGYNAYRDVWFKHYFFVEPTFEDESHVLFLNHQDYLQFLMISHLPWADIVTYFIH